MKDKKIKKKGLAGDRTRIAGFKVLSANHYTTKPMHGGGFEPPKHNANDLESFPFDQTWVSMLIPTPGLEPGSAG